MVDSTKEGKSVGQRAAEAALESYRRDPRAWDLKGEATPAHPMFAGYIVCYEEREAELLAARRAQGDAEVEEYRRALAQVTSLFYGVALPPEYQARVQAALDVALPLINRTEPRAKADARVGLRAAVAERLRDSMERLERLDSPIMSAAVSGEQDALHWIERQLDALAQAAPEGGHDGA